MTQVLRLFIPADWPAQRTACEWSLVNAAGARLQQGCSDPRHWPEADSCELVLSAEQCLLLTAHLPKGARARSTEVLAYALEDQLIGDAEAEHFVAGERAARPTNSAEATATPVWVVARARLRALLAALQPLARAPQRVISELQLAPWQTGGWSICLSADKADGSVRQLTRGFARLAEEAGFSFDLEDLAAPPHVLRLALQAARKAGDLPGAIDIHVGPGVTFDASTAEAWHLALGLPVRLAGEYAWRDASPREARNLLCGEFAPPRKMQDGWGALRPALFVGLAALVLYAAFAFGEWAWLAHQRNHLQQQMIDGFRAAFPQTQAIVDAPLQMQRLHDQLRRERGQLGSADFLPLLAAISEVAAGQGKLRNVSFEDGRLEFTIGLKSATAAEDLREILSRRGLSVILRDSHPAAGGVEAVFAVRGAS